MHHAHALACLRELNNNPGYSESWAINGKKAAEIKRNAEWKSSGAKGLSSFGEKDGGVKVPRLIVEFAVSSVSVLLRCVFMYFTLLYTVALSSM